MKLFDVYSLYDIEPVRGKGKLCLHRRRHSLSRLLRRSRRDLHRSLASAICRCRQQTGVSGFAFYSNSVKNTLQQRLADLLGEISGYDDYQALSCQFRRGSQRERHKTRIFRYRTPQDSCLRQGVSRTHISRSCRHRQPPHTGSSQQDRQHRLLPLNDIEAATRLLESQEFAAVIIEGIQGVAGIRMVDDDFLRRLSEVAAATGTLLIADEIQSGYGRTGKFFAHQHAGIRPDIITSAKALRTDSRCRRCSCRRRSDRKKGCSAQPSEEIISPVQPQSRCLR